ncbi:hypothetical protein NDU88_002493 [Pleurodeles waltl]|uniref:Uncharacterized protein n=1 Tax=Pleurodeles waltl TaxID=8319 RepID=A0AAV7LG24_PLEWA|nr:hypothetical protein NDU88_002493 [Pleurodeles waltl]
MGVPRVMWTKCLNARCGKQEAGKLVTLGSAANKDTITRYNPSWRVYCSKPTTRQLAMRVGPPVPLQRQRSRVRRLCEAVPHFIQVLDSGAGENVLPTGPRILPALSGPPRPADSSRHARNRVRLL